MVTDSKYSAAYERFRALLKQLRESRKFSQADVAARLNSPQSYVSKYETGERRLDFVEAQEVCMALGTTLVEFAKLFEKSGRSSRMSRPPKTKRGGKA